MEIVAFDPGITTGWAGFDSSTYCSGVVDSSLCKIEQLLDNLEPKVVGYEDFKHRPNMMRAELYSIQVIGVVRLWCEKRGIEPFRYLPATAKAFWDDKKLRLIGLYRLTQHERDATRVLLKYLSDSDKDWHDSTINSLRPSTDLRSP